MAEILQQIDREIAQLQRARALLNGGAGRNTSSSVNGIPRRAKRKKSNLTPEGRKRIAEAVKRRWEKQRKASVAK